MQTKKRTKSIIICVAFILVILAIRELGIIDLNWYRYSHNTTTNSSWLCATYNFDANTAISPPSDQLTNPLVKIFFHDQTLYQDKRLESIADNAIVISIEEIDPGFLWVPFYKSSPYSAFAKIHYGTGEEGKTKAHTGTLNLYGNISIIGACSHADALKLVQQQIINSLMEETTKHFQANN